MHITLASPHMNNVKRVVIMVQAKRIPDTLNDTKHSVVWKDLLQCIANVGKAKQISEEFHNIPWVNITQSPRFEFQVYVSLPLGLGKKLRPQLKALGPSYVHIIEEKGKNYGMDIRQFLVALRRANTGKKRAIDYILKIHSKTDMGWRRQALSSLCGTPAQIISILKAFESEKSNIGVVVPQGLVISEQIPKNELYTPLRKYYKSPDSLSPKHVFNEANTNNMKLIYRRMFGKELDPDMSKYMCNAGTMFWTKYDDFEGNKWHQLLFWLRGKWTDGYVQDGGVEHAIERLFVTIPFLHGVDIAEIVPAPKPIGIYFPQYHRIPENDRIHGDGFTEWTLLKPSKVEYLAKPLPIEEGGLGYYDLTDIKIRRKQAKLARQAGLHGFMYYHYWFSGNSSFEYKNPVMGKIPELMLEDGEPNFPFMFSWANEPWTSTWSGGDGSVFLPQNYGGLEEWKKHFNYLLPFFKHHNYICVDEKPAYVIYRVGLMTLVLRDMIQLWRDMAVAAGLPGLHIIYTLNNFAKRDLIFKNKLHKYCDASFQFFPTIASAYRDVKNASSTAQVLNRAFWHRQYWGGFTGFSNIVRRHDNLSWTRLVPPQEFKDSMLYSLEAMTTMLPATKLQVREPNLFFITAWNEWNEQAQLEPSDKHGFSYLSVIKASVENMPMKIIKSLVV